MNVASIAIVFSVVLIVPFFAVGMQYSSAFVLFGVLSLLLAPLAIHGVSNSLIAGLLLIGLGRFASFPLKKLYVIEGMVPKMSISLACAALLFVVGFGWKRSWK